LKKSRHDDDDDDDTETADPVQAQIPSHPGIKNLVRGIPPSDVQANSFDDSSQILFKRRANWSKNDLQQERALSTAQLDAIDAGKYNIGCMLSTRLIIVQKIREHPATCLGFWICFFLIGVLNPGMYFKGCGAIFLDLHISILNPQKVQQHNSFDVFVGHNVCIFSPRLPGKSPFLSLALKSFL